MTTQEVLTFYSHENQKKKNEEEEEAKEEERKKGRKKFSQKVLQRSTSSFCWILAGSNLLNLCFHQSNQRMIHYS